MKKLLTLLITVSLATAAMAQENEASPSKKKHRKGDQPAAAEKATRPAQKPARPTRNAAQPNKPHEGRKARQKAPDTAPTATMNSNGQPAAEANRHKKRMEKEQTDAATNKTAAAPDRTNVKTPTGASTAANQPPKKRNGKARKPDPQVVQQVRNQHSNFKARPKPEKVPAVTYNESYRIRGAQQWQGPQYEVFRTYRPQRHDQNWYRSHYSRVEIIAGGAYYFSNGFWFPAWGYNPSYQYYAYDAPIYVGSRAEPPDRVIANVQAILQEEGYYKGEVDGLLGPLTRDALVGYQTDNGLYATATIDEPTLESLDLG